MRWYALAVVVILVTIGVVLAGLSLAAFALVVAWLAGNFGIDRLLAVVGACTGVVGLLVTVSVPLGKWLLQRNRRG